MKKERLNESVTHLDFPIVDASDRPISPTIERET